VATAISISESQIERVRNRRLGAARPVVMDARPAQTAADPRTILVHRCFAQIAGATKSASCVCRERITFSEALILITEKKADWLLVKNPKATNLVAFQRAIVIRQSKTAVKKYKARRAEGLTFQKSFLPIESTILKEFRKFLCTQAHEGNLPDSVLDWNDELLKSVLRDPEVMIAQVPEFLVKGESENPKLAPKLFKKLVEWSAKWWDDVQSLYGLDDETTGTYAANGQAGGSSPLEYVEDLDSVSANTRAFDSGSDDDSIRSVVDSAFDCETTGQRKVVAANHRAQAVLDANGEPTGEWDFSTGSNPEVDNDAE
jgi:hypothetical protein